MHRYEVGRMGAVVICDEIHHCGTVIEGREEESTAFGFGVESVHETARLTIYGTGTPYRSDSRRLPGLEYGPPNESGLRQIKADVTLTISEAIDLGYTRPIHFRNFAGDREIRRLDHGEVCTESIQETYRSLTALCRDPANWQPLVNTCAEELDGRMLVIAADIDHARSVNAYIRSAFPRVKPTLVTSADDAAADILEAFEPSDSQCLVTVGMASEGYDCPSLTHLVYLNPARTLLSLDQGVSRVGRNNPERDAMVYGPGDKPWLDYVERYELECRAGLEMRQARREREGVERTSEIASLSGYLGSGGSDEIESRFGGECYERPEVVRIAKIANVEPSTVIRVLRASETAHDSSEATHDPNSDDLRAAEGRRVFGKGGVIPRLHWKLFGSPKTNPGGLVRATARRYTELHGHNGHKKPFPVDVTREYERIAIDLVTSPELRPAWFRLELEEHGAANN